MQSVLFLSHGGGPLPLLEDAGHTGMLVAFEKIRKTLETLPAPKALLYISAHWEASPVSITAATTPELYYDYYGFPAESYKYRYPVPGAPELANTIVTLLTEQNIPAQLDAVRGLDHGVFVPGLLLFPQANIPTLQLSLSPDLDPQFHLRLGHALHSLRGQEVMIIGSGFSFHNMGAFFADPDSESDQLNQHFESWLSETLMLPDRAEREQRLIEWTEAPGARFCHPREEHLMPLHVCVGAVDVPVTQQWRFDVLGKQGSCYLWN